MNVPQTICTYVSTYVQGPWVQVFRLEPFLFAKVLGLRSLRFLEGLGFQSVSASKGTRIEGGLEGFFSIPCCHGLAVLETQKGDPAMGPDDTDQSSL